MAAVDRVGIVGAGVAGMAAAILLAEGGVEVEVLDAQPKLSALGSGITIQGNALRVLGQLGVWPEVQRHSYGFDLLGLRAPGPEAKLLAEFPDQRIGGPDYPATVGMYRPDLARILTERAQEVGAKVRFGVRIVGLTDLGDQVEATFEDGSTATYDLLVGADGLHSTVRRLAGIDLQPRRLGMGIFRAFVARPASVTHTELYYGGACFIAGYCPTGEDTMYAYLVEDARGQDRSGLSVEENAAIMAGLSEGYGGPWNDIRPELATSRRINYTWFTEHLVPGAWNRGRVVLIGEAAHSCPPTIAQGAALAAEDGAVLAELLLAADRVDANLWDAFHARRLPRAKAVVDASVQLAEWLLAGDQSADVPGLMGRTMALVARPA